MNAYERFMITTGARPFSINEKSFLRWQDVVRIRQFLLLIESQLIRHVITTGKLGWAVHFGVSMMPCALVWGEVSSKGNRKMLKINLSS